MDYRLNAVRFHIEHEAFAVIGSCNECMDKLSIPFLSIVSDGESKSFCKRCSYKIIESHQAKLQFLANDINRLKEFFPKKVKTKTGDINFGEHL